MRWSSTCLAWAWVFYKAVPQKDFHPTKTAQEDKNSKPITVENPPIITPTVNSFMKGHKYKQIINGWIIFIINIILMYSRKYIHYSNFVNNYSALKSFCRDCEINQDLRKRGGRRKKKKLMKLYNNNSSLGSLVVHLIPGNHVFIHKLDT